MADKLIDYVGLKRFKDNIISYVDLNCSDGWVTKKTTFSEDGNTITETDENGVKTKDTVFSTNSDGNETITETLYDTDGTTVTGTKVTTFNSDGSISEEATLS